jgi:hypothetical protein
MRTVFVRNRYGRERSAQRRQGRNKGSFSENLSQESGAVIFYMSAPGRRIYEFMNSLQKTKNFSVSLRRTVCDTLALRLPEHLAVSLIRGKPKAEYSEYLKRLPIYKDCPKDFDFQDFYEGYNYLTQQFVVRDFSRIDLLSIAHIVRSYDDRAIFRLGNRCKKLKKFSIPYLSATMEAEAAEVVEGIRKENRLDDLVRETVHLELGTYRPINILERMEDLEEERRLKTIEEP